MILNKACRLTRLSQFPAVDIVKSCWFLVRALRDTLLISPKARNQPPSLPRCRPRTRNSASPSSLTSGGAAVLCPPLLRRKERTVRGHPWVKFISWPDGVPVLCLFNHKHPAAEVDHKPKRPTAVFKCQHCYDDEWPINPKLEDT